MISDDKKIRLTILIWLVLLYSITFPLSGQDRSLTINIEFASAVQAEYEIATLKYNKDFAFSFAFDDGLDDAFTLGFRLLNGGLSSEDQNNYPGLYYTDGCGNRIAFTAGIAWYSANKDGVDLHNGNTPGYMTWSQVLQLYHSGWNLFNHSYNHEANTAGIDYTDQISRNAEAVFNRLGFHLNYLIPPGGDGNYINPGFDMGIYAVFTSNSGYTSNGTTAVIVDEIDHERPVFWRHSITSDEFSAEALKSAATDIFAEAGANKHLWWNEFTHRVKYERYGGSVEFTEFKDYMEFLETQYGEKGLDNGWFASAIEVYEYLLIRDMVTVTKTISDNSLQLKIDYSNCPADLRYYDISLLISTDNTIVSAQADHSASISYNKKDGKYLFNVILPDSYFSGTESVPLSDEKLDVLIYPVPLQDRIYIKTNKPLPEGTQLIMTDLLGHYSQLSYNRINDMQLSVQLNKMNKVTGVYFLQLIHNGVILNTKKVLIK